MNKRLTLSFAVLLSITQMCAQLQRDDAFHSKYTLSGVTVFSRHGVRSAEDANVTFVKKITPSSYNWYNFGIPSEYLTRKGGVLETINGEFFNLWAVNEGLFKVNDAPADGESYIISDSAERTIATARFFTSGFMPMKDTITVNHIGAVDTTSKAFDLTLGDDLTDEQMKQIKEEYDSACSSVAMSKTDSTLKPAYDILMNLLDIKNSSAYQDGTFTGFNKQSHISVKKGERPKMEGNLKNACNILDPLRMQYYDDPDHSAATFGNTITKEDWITLDNAENTYKNLRFSSPTAQRYLTQQIRQYITEGLQTEGRKVTLITGHDDNQILLLKAMHYKEFTDPAPDHIGLIIPIGAKIVFEKWMDKAGNQFVATNLYYQTIDQILNTTILDLTNNRPSVVPLQFEGLEPNADGLIPLDKMLDRLALKNLPASVSSITRQGASKSMTGYTINGIPATESYKGISIHSDAAGSKGKKGNKKVMNK